MLEKTFNSIRVWSSSSKLTKAKHFRVSMVLIMTGISLKEAFKQICWYHLRLKWDDVLNKPRIIRRFIKEENVTDTQVDICRYMTKEVAGGLISPRVFTDIRMFYGYDSENHMVLGSSHALPPAQNNLIPPSPHEGSGDVSEGSHSSPIEFTPKEKKCTLATNLIGGGMRCDVLDGRSDITSGAQITGERAKRPSFLEGSSILAMKCAKWLQTATSPTKQTHPIRLACPSLKMRLASLGAVRFTMSSLTKLGGWLPQALINSSTGSAMHEIFRNYVDNFHTFGPDAKCEVIPDV